MKKTLSIMAFIAFLMTALTGCSLFPGNAAPTPSPFPTDNAAGSRPTMSPQSTATPTPTTKPSPTPVVTHVALGAIGDILLHNTVYQDAYRGENGYDFKPMFEQVRDYMRQTDLLVANQESITGGKELGLSSYPLFNSPHEIGDALLDAGVKMITMANNHTMDKGEPGILSAIAYWDKLGMPYTGAFASPEDRDRIRVVTENGISFAFLAYTYGTNGLAVPADKPYLVNRIDEPLMQADIERARKLADVVVVSAHWGIEDQPTENQNQRTLAAKLAEWGADIIIGTHPHVLQPFAWLPRSDGKRTLVMYSLGNFLSAQDQMPELIGGVAGIEVTKTVTGANSAIVIEHPVFLPTYNKYEGFRHFRVVPLIQLDPADSGKVLPVWEPIKQRMLAEMPELVVKDSL